MVILFSYSRPIFKWKAGLKYTRVELAYITDDILRLVLEKNMKGGLASVMANPFVKTGDTSKIKYGDITNIYRTIMSQYLPTRNFDEIEVTERNEEHLLAKLLDAKNDHKHGYFIERESEYPQSILKKI